jgi:hypothetical protein
MAARFPQGHVLVVPGAGHSVLNHSPCAANAVRSWLKGGNPPSVCTKFSLYVPPVGAWRKSVAATPPVARVPGLAGRTLAGVLQTIHDAEDYWLLLRGSHETFTGLVGGTLTPDPNGAIRLANFSSIPGLSISGSILVKIDPYGDPVVPLSVGYAQVTVGGRGAAHGKLSLSGNRLTGTLAKRKVAATF